MNFVEILQTKTKDAARAFVNEQLSVRAITRIDELSKATLSSYIKKSVSDVQSDRTSGIDKAINKLSGGKSGSYTFKEGSTNKPEGAIYSVGRSAPLALGADVADKLDARGDKYGPTGTIRGDDGSVHHIYSAHGIFRVRPVGSTSKEQTEKLVKHLGGMIEESVEQINEYHAVGKVGDKIFRVATDDDYESKDKVAKQNPHLNKYEVDALHAHLNSDGFENDEVHSSTQNNIRVTSNSGGYYGNFSDSKSKMNLKESVDNDDRQANSIKGFVNDTPFRLNLAEDVIPQLSNLSKEEVAAVQLHLVSEEFKEDITSATMQGEFEVATSK